MTTQTKKINAGINYLRLMKNGHNVYDIAEEFDEDVEHVKACIAAARKNKDEADTNIKVQLVPPRVQVYDEYHTGRLQVVKKVKVELLKDIIAKFAEDEVTEFQTLMPVKITIKRK